MGRANKEFRSDGLAVCNRVSFITELWLLVLQIIVDISCCHR